MLDLDWIEIENFRSYAGKHEFQFPKEPGLYFLSGDNQFEKTLESNGAGKTTFLDAIFWCLYGRTCRGLKGPEIKTWGVTGRTSVALGLTVNAVPVVITRTQGPNSLKVDIDGHGSEPEQSTINDLIRMTEDMFMYSVMTSQVGDMFFDLKASTKLNLFSQIMGLDYWLTLSEDAKRTAKAIDTSIKTITNELSGIDGRIDALTESLGRMKDQQQTFEKECNIKIKELDRTLTAIKATHKDNKDKLQTLKDRRDGFIQDSNDLKSQISENNETLETLNASQADLRATIKALDKDIEREELVIQNLRKAKGKCPTCLQPVTADHIEDEAAEINKRIKRARGNKNNFLDEIHDIQKDIDNARDTGVKLGQKANKIEKQYRDAQEDYSILKSRIENTNAEIDRIIDAIKDEETKPNPYTKSINETDNQLDKLDLQKGKLEKDLTTLNEDLETSLFWINGFKRVRLYIIGEVLRQLEVEINNNLIQIGLVGWSVMLDIEKETKSGTVSSGFNVMIIPATTDTPARWESWSMGETQRLRLSGSMAVSNLIFDRIGMQTGFEFYDEVSQHTSPRGIHDMLDALQERAINMKKKIWLVDHQVYDYGWFKGELHITKDEQGSSLAYRDLREGE